jgi:hypothetical protein
MKDIRVRHGAAFSSSQDSYFLGCIDLDELFMRLNLLLLISINLNGASAPTFKGETK